MNKYLIISGRVQGVGFRYAAQQKARALELAGWVQNQPDGTVKMEIEGDSRSIDTFMVALKSGFNPFIRVDHIEEQNVQTHKGYRTFSIK